MACSTNKQVCTRLARLRKEFAARQFSAWIAPTGDPHLSEYLPEHWALRKYLSGFTGSAGTLVVTETKAALWTDSRYWEQAERQLAGTGIELMRDGESATPKIGEWLSASVPRNSVVGADLRTLSSRVAYEIEQILARRNISLSHDGSVIDKVWKDRPAASLNPVRLFEYGGATRRQKLSRVRSRMRKEGAGGLLISTLDDIAWMTNLRGDDIACTPVFLAFLLITRKQAFLFIDPRKISEGIVSRLAQDGIQCRPYEQIWTESLALVPESGALWLDERRTSALFVSLAQSAEYSIIDSIQPTMEMKAHKDRRELRLIEQAMEYDGAALCEFYSWLEGALRRGGALSEWRLSEKLHEFRARSSHFFEESFTTIVAVDANAAEPHYTPDKSRSALLKGASVLLIDSGAQYDCGTTDITRTTAIGDVPKQARCDYTAVLRGHIALASTLFPDGVFSGQLDTIARMPVWQIGEDYGHGTGYGVGFHLSVHEGPASISPRAPAENSSRVHPGLLVSNEPGLYRAGLWGIRIENLVTPVKAGSMLRFKTLTLCPIDTRLIEREMLSEAEVAWLNAYHRMVRSRLTPLVSPEAAGWLEEATRPL